LKITIVICTANRDRPLARLLESIALAAPPRHAAWEVVVVNNGSRDATDDVIETFASRLSMRRVFEPVQGISHARNAGVAAAAGDYLLWTDDDTTIDAGWLRAYEGAFERHPEAAFFGGPIRPRFVGTPPRWLASGLPCVSGAYAGLNLAIPEGAIDPAVHELPYGANMATRSDVQRRHRFDPRYGRRGPRGLLNGEESDMLRRMVGAGASGVWLPDAIVDHWIEPARQTVGYLRRYYRGSGATHGIRDRQEGQEATLRGLLGMGAEAVAYQGIYVLGRVLALPDLWLRALVKSECVRGRLAAHARKRPVAPEADMP
jgi:glycosyltransferase involved in cell wall biosynthesis